MRLSDISISKAVSDGVWIDIVALGDMPDLGIAEGEATGLQVKVLSIYSKAWRDAQERVWGRRSMNKATAEEIDRNQAELLAAVTVDWKAFEDDDGNPLPCTRENVLKVFTSDGHRWIREQVDEAVAKKRLFFGKSKTD